MVKSQTVRSINNLEASMSSLMHRFAAIAGSIRTKTKMDITRPPLMDILLKGSAQDHVLTTGEKKFYQHTVTLSLLCNHANLVIETWKKS